ncbi:hypothetical protein B0H13DRAFT_1946235, partial [Mycena leptocephala]
MRSGSLYLSRSASRFFLLSSSFLLSAFCFLLSAFFLPPFHSFIHSSILHASPSPSPSIFPCIPIRRPFRQSIL